MNYYKITTVGEPDQMIMTFDGVTTSYSSVAVEDNEFIIGTESVCIGVTDFVSNVETITRTEAQAAGVDVG